MSHAAPERKAKLKPCKTTPLVEQLAQLRNAMGAKVRAGDGDSAIETLLEIIAAQHHDIDRLTRLYKVAQRARFGRRTEKLTAEELGQLALALGATDEEAAGPEPQVPATEQQEEDAGDNSGAPMGNPPRKKGSKKGRHPGRTRLDPALARRVTLHTVPDEERDCIHCGTAMQTIGHIDHERVDYIPARLEVEIDRREKIACMACHQDIATAGRPGNREEPRRSKGGAMAHDDTQPGIVPLCGGSDAEAESSGAGGEEAAIAVQFSATAPTQTAGSQPDHAIAPGAHVYRRAGASLLAHLLEAKCDDALPIYRQRQQLARLGFDVPLNTLYGYWDAASRLVQPVAQVVLSEVLGKSIVGVDDTRLDWLDPAAKAARKRGHLWCFVGDGDLVAFEFTESWAADEVAPWIDAIDGYIQCDDYKGYSALREVDDKTKVPLVPPARRLGCWMHVRRPFHQAFKAGEKQAIIPLGHIKDLYAVEAKARDASMTPDERLALRQRESVPVAEAFFAWVRDRQGLERPGSYVGQGLRYALDQEAFVMRCLTHGRFELDTGRVERQIREPVIGRKNYLFSGSAAAASRLAGVYTLVCSCQNLGINTRAYLTDIIIKLQAGYPLREINRLRPDVWAAERSTLVAHQLAQ